MAASVRSGLEQGERATAHNGQLVLNVCFNYGGRWDIVQAARRLAEAGSGIDEESLAAAMALGHVPDPELLIRSSGEQRISNFLLWQIAYAELHFTPVLWPDFRKEHLFQAVLDYQSRERRFGKTGEQISTPQG